MREVGNAQGRVHQSVKTALRVLGEKNPTTGMLRSGQEPDKPQLGTCSWFSPLFTHSHSTQDWSQAPGQDPFP